MTRVSGSYLLKRIGASILVIFVLISLLFVLTLLLPGGLESHFISSEMDSEDAEAVEDQFTVDGGLLEQYVSWVVSYATFDFGYSTDAATPVEDRLLERLPATIALFGTAFLINYSLGTVLGIHFGWKRGSKQDKAGFVAGLLMYSLPAFWVGWILLLVLAFGQVGPEWFPTAHMTAPFESEYSAFGLMGQMAYHLFLPALTLVLVGWAGAMLITRTAMQNVVHKPYIRTARAKGLTEREIKYKHAGRNALIPVSTQGIIGIAFIIDGAIIIEEVFSWPGMGELLVQSILQQDYPTAMAAFFLFGLLVVVLRLVTDILYTYLDPRIKFGDSS